MRLSIGILRSLAVVVGVIALIGRYFYGVGNITFTVGNYFAYLTIQSNIAAMIMFGAGAVGMFRTHREAPWMSTLRMLVTSWMAVAGVVFTILVAESGNHGYPIGIPWSDALLHYALPGFAVVDWLLAPGRHRTRWALVAVTLGYPIVWGVITLIRGPLVGWYPYFFLDPVQVGSPLEFFGYSAAALSIFAGVAVVLTAAARMIRPLDVS